MGVDFFACDDCGKTFPDCGPCAWCECGAHFCPNCMHCVGYDENDVPTCSVCRLEIIPDDVLVRFLLRKLKMKRKTAEEEYRRRQKKRKE